MLASLSIAFVSDAVSSAVKVAEDAAGTSSEAELARARLAAGPSGAASTCSDAGMSSSACAAVPGQRTRGRLGRAEER